MGILITQARLFDDNAAIRRRQRAMLERWVRSLVIEVASEACDAATDEVVAAQLEARATLRHAMAAAGVLDAMPLAFGSKRHTDRADAEPARPRRSKRRARRAAGAAQSSAVAEAESAAAREQAEAFVPAAGVTCECFYAGARETLSCGAAKSQAARFASLTRALFLRSRASIGDYRWYRAVIEGVWSAEDIERCGGDAQAWPGEEAPFFAVALVGYGFQQTVPRSWLRPCSDELLADASGDGEALAAAEEAVESAGSQGSDDADDDSDDSDGDDVVEVDVVKLAGLRNGMTEGPRAPLSPPRALARKRVLTDRRLLAVTNALDTTPTTSGNEGRTGLDAAESLMRRAAEMLEGEELPTAAICSERALEEASQAARRSGPTDEVRKALIRYVAPSHERALRGGGGAGGPHSTRPRAQPATAVKPPAAQKRGKRAAPGWRGSDAPNPHAGVSDKYWAQASKHHSKTSVGKVEG